MADNYLKQSQTAENSVLHVSDKIQVMALDMYVSEGMSIFRKPKSL